MGVRAQIADGTLRPGDKVPSLAVLSAQHNCNHQTCAKALRLLESEGLVNRLPGRGYFVREALTIERSDPVA